MAVEDFGHLFEFVIVQFQYFELGHGCEEVAIYFLDIVLVEIQFEQMFEVTETKG